MKKGLSAREKVLIFAAAALVLVFLSSRYLIIPMYEGYNSMANNYGLLSTNKALLELKLRQEPVTASNLEAALESFKAVEERYPPAMPSEEVGRVLTELCIENNLVPVTLGISEAVAFEAPSKDAENASDADAEQEKPPSAFSVVTANMALGGDYNALKSLINAVDKIDYIRISRVSFSFPQGESGAVQSNISVFFEVTMLGGV